MRTHCLECFRESLFPAFAVALVLLSCAYSIGYLIFVGRRYRTVNGDAIFCLLAFIGTLGFFPLISITQLVLRTRRLAGYLSAGDGARATSKTGQDDHEMVGDIDSIRSEDLTVLRNGVHWAVFSKHVGDCTSDFVLVMACVSLFGNSLAPAALLAICGLSVDYLLANRYIKQYLLNARFSVTKNIVLVESLAWTCLGFSLAFLFFKDVLSRNSPGNTDIQIRKRHWVFDWSLEQSDTQVNVNTYQGLVERENLYMAMLFVFNSLGVAGRTLRASYHQRLYETIVHEKINAMHRREQIYSENLKDHFSPDMYGFKNKKGADSFTYHSTIDPFHSENSLEEEHGDGPLLQENDDKVYGTWDTSTSQSLSGNSELSNEQKYSPWSSLDQWKTSSAIIDGTTKDERFEGTVADSLRLNTASFALAGKVVPPVILGCLLELIPNPALSFAVSVLSLVFWQIVALSVDLACFRALFVICKKNRNQQTNLPFHETESTLGRWFCASQIGRSFDSFKDHCKQFIDSPIFLASLSNAFLFMSTLDCSIVSLSYFRWSGVSTAVIGFLISLQYLSCGFIPLCRYLYRFTGSLAITTSLFFWLLWLTTLPAAFCFFFFTDRLTRTVGLLFSVLASRPIFRAHMYNHDRLLEDWVESLRQKSVIETETSLRFFFAMMINMLVFCLDSPAHYDLILYVSVATSSGSLLLFLIWYHLFDVTTPFQVVNDIGQVISVVRG